MAYLFLLIILFLIGTLTGSSAAIVFSVVILAIGRAYSNNTKSGTPNGAWRVYLVTFIVYALLALIRTLDIDIPEPFFDTLFKTGGDEDGFFEKSQIAARQSSFYDAVFGITSTLLSSYIGEIETIMAAPGYHMYIGLIAYMSNTFLDGNAIIVQLLGSVLFGSLLSVVLYKIIALHLPSKKAVHYALLGSLCTAYVYFGVWLLRDIHVTFFFALVFYNIMQPYSRNNLIKMLVLVLITASFRVWSAIFLAVFVLYYVYRRFKNNKVAVVCLGIVGAAVVAVAALPLLGDAADRLMMFASRTERLTVEESAYLQVLYKLPTPIKEVAVMASNYMTPFTSWNELSTNNNIFHNLYKFTVVVYEFYWFLVVWLATKWCVLNKGLKKLPELLFWILMIVLAYLFISASSDFTVRRTMCMYPIMYLTYVYLKEYAIPKKQFKKDLYAPLVFYALGFVVFVIL